MIFDGLPGLLRVVVVGTASYVALLIVLKISGQRTLAKLNAFDFVVTIALGSTLSTMLLSKDVALAEGVVALALLVTLQFVVAWLVARSSRIERLVKSEPALLYRNGFLTDAMRRSRVSESELRQAARGQGHADLEHVAGMVLESDGTISVLSEIPRFDREPDRGS